MDVIFKRKEIIFKKIVYEQLGIRNNVSFFPLSQNLLSIAALYWELSRILLHDRMFGGSLLHRRQVGELCSSTKDGPQKTSPWC